MSAPTISVGVALGVPEASDFIIGDATRGVVGNMTYLIGTGYSTVTPSSFSVSISRGRFSRLWDAVDAGKCNIRLFNYDRSYDPAYLLSPYSGYITPGRGVNIKANDIDIFTGFVDDWDLNYEVDGVSTATLKSTDALGVLGQMQFDAWTNSATRADTKLAAICDRSEVAWSSAMRDFDEGVEALASHAVSWGSNTLNAVQLIARSDLGYLFSSADGLLTFRNRQVAVGVTSRVSFSDTAGLFDAPILDESGDPIFDEFGDPLTSAVNVIPFQGIAATLGSELLFARVSVDREGVGTAQTATVADLAAWQRHYGPIRSLSVTGLLLDSDAQSLALAEYLLALHDTPRYRISELTVDLTPLDAQQQATVLALDITNTIDVTFTPDGVGDPIMQTLVVQGIEHNISTERHTVTLSVIDGPYPYFRVGDATYGVIGPVANNQIGF